MKDKGRKGLTLVEVIITLGLLSIIVLSVSFVFLTIFNSWYAQSEITDQRLRSYQAFEFLTKELRQSFLIVSADESNISFWRDINENGVFEDPEELVVYSWAGLDQPLVRQAGAAREELLSGVKELSFRFFDNNNQQLLSPLILNQIKSVSVLMVSASQDDVVRQRSRVRIRNL